MRKSRLYAGVALLCALAMAFAMVAASGCGKKTPTITSVSPSSGAAGAEVTIKGSNFGAHQDASTVGFGSVTVSAEDWSDSEIKAKVPSDLEAGEYEVSVTTTDGTSGNMQFEVTKAEAEPRKEGHIEHNDPEQAMIAFMKKNGMDPTGYTFSVYKVSKEDPKWKIDEASKSGTQSVFFLLHNVNEEWTVVAYGTDFNPQQNGAPGDLTWGGPPAPSPQPDMSKQNQAVLNYIQSQGLPTNDWKLTLVKVSKADSNWEVIKGTEISTNQSKDFLLVWNNMAGAWEVLSDAGPPWTGVEFKGEAVPSDLTSL